MEDHKTDFLIVGGGIMGLTIARELSLRRPGLKISLLEKEERLSSHASGRNSGVIHAGFYYTPDSLKARLTAEGNRLLTEYCVSNGLKINRCGKVVVAKDEAELKMLHELKRRGDANGVELSMIDEKELAEVEPNASTHRRALFSPATSTIDPVEVSGHIAGSLKGKVEFLLNERFVRRGGEDFIETDRRRISFAHLVNTAGLYADKVAHQFNAGKRYALIPFKGLYMEYGDSSIIKRHIYPVPNLRNPFLGVHFTKTVEGKVKIGPTAIPAFWRENYGGLSGFSLSELFDVLSHEARLFLRGSFNFRALAFEEAKKYFGRCMQAQASKLVKSIDTSGFGPFIRPGIRAQLLDVKARSLVMDFVIEHRENSTHLLNAVSPAFTCSFPFSSLVVDEMEKRMLKKI
ncbi:MAG: L-2-hydroxyglutarate oxidase [Deltaproteobacteria bacterium]|nr:L-2-hydroxyglutarate oxidase [Deltaproteobacteria bacterium]